MYDTKDDDNSIKKLAEDEQESDKSSVDIQEDYAFGGEDKLKMSYPADGQLQSTDATKLRAALEKANNLASLGYSKEQIVRALFGEGGANSVNEKPRGDHAASKQEVGAQVTQPSLKGKTFGKYQILDLIGKGGMSTVYRTNNLETQRVVACKVLLPRLLDDRKNRRRFEHEAEAAQRLTHQNIINVHDFGETDGQPFMIMDYLDGISLSDLIETSGKLTIARALPVFLQICDALAFAHKRDIVHRDLKPSNIMLSGKEGSANFVKVVDFGIAKIIKEHTEESTKLTKSGEIFGSPLYMSPEQCVGQPVDRRSDIYSFGVLMYEVIKGKPPLEGPDPLSTMFKQMNDNPEDLGNIDPDVRLVQSMESIIFKCMNKSPAARYQNMESIRTDLEHAIAIGNSGSKTLAKVLRLFAGFQRTASHELTSAAKSQRKLLLLTTSASLVLLPVIGTIFLFWPLRYAWGAVPNALERKIDLIPIVVEPNRVGLPAKADLASPTSKLSTSTFSELIDISGLEPCLAKAGQYFRAGLYQEAIPFYDAAENICLKNKMEDSDEIIEASTNHAECLLRLHSYSQARSLAAFAAGRLGKIGNNNGPKALLVLGKLAFAYYADGRIDDAFQAYEDFVSLLTANNIAKCKNRNELAYSIAAAGKFYQDRNEPNKALRLLQSAQSLWEESAQQLPINTGIPYNLGVVQNDLGLVEESLNNNLAAHEELLKARINMMNAKGEQNLNCAKILFNDSDAQWKLNQWYESLEKRSRAKKIWSNSYQAKFN